MSNDYFLFPEDLEHLEEYEHGDLQRIVKTQYDWIQKLVRTGNKMFSHLTVHSGHRDSQGTCGANCPACIEGRKLQEEWKNSLTNTT